MSVEGSFFQQILRQPEIDQRRYAKKKDERYKKSSPQQLENPPEKSVDRSCISAFRWTFRPGIDQGIEGFGTNTNARYNQSCLQQLEELKNLVNPPDSIEIVTKKSFFSEGGDLRLNYKDVPLRTYQAYLECAINSNTSKEFINCEKFLDLKK